MKDLRPAALTALFLLIFLGAGVQAFKSAVLSRFVFNTEKLLVALAMLAGAAFILFTLFLLARKENESKLFPLATFGLFFYWALLWKKQCLMI